MKSVLLMFATLMTIMICVTLCGCAGPRQHVKYELKEQVTVKEDWTANKPGQTATIDVMFGQSW